MRGKLSPATLSRTSWHAGPCSLRAVDDFIAKDRELYGRRLGFPVIEEQPAGEDGSGRIQFFENGVVTLRDGKREIWLRPIGSNPALDAESNPALDRLESAG
jgi:hypothetical protein